MKHSGLRHDGVTKKCPWCLAYIPMASKRCPQCQGKVGDVDKTGMAKKPTDWTAYGVAIVAIVAFGVFIWWAFFSG